MQLKFVDIEAAVKFISLASKWGWLNDFYGFDNQDFLVKLIFPVIPSHIEPPQLP